MMTTPEGLALYVRRIGRRHGTPKQFAKLYADNGLTWVALGGIWQQPRSGKVRSGRMNSVDTFKRYAEELHKRGVEVYAWGYPWMGEETRFRDMMLDYFETADSAAIAPRILLDPELGSNPTRSSKGAGKRNANLHAQKLVKLFHETDRVRILGLSTFGSGWRMKWFPLQAFTEALALHFGGRTFIGGQTYTDNTVIDRSMSDMARVIDKAGGQLAGPFMTHLSRGVAVVPNFGTYTWTKDGKRGKRRPGAKAVRKTPEELRLHLYEFVDDEFLVDALIGWAENFVDRKLWKELARFADMMRRGACTL